MIKATCLALVCLLAASCAGMPLIGGESEDVLTGAENAFTLHMAPGWSAREKGTQTQAGQGAPGRIYVLGPSDPAKAPNGYPSLVVREIREQTPRGLLDLMAKDKDLNLAELWGMGRDSFQLKQVLFDANGRMLSYWLSPRDGQGVEYYCAVLITGFGRLEMTGVAKAGTVPQYLKDFNAMFLSVRTQDKAGAVLGQGVGLSGYLSRVYQEALTREMAALERQAGEVAAMAAAGSGLGPQERGILAGAYPKAVRKALDSGQGARHMLAGGEFPGRGGQIQATWSRLQESLDDAVLALETIGLNLRGEQARAAMEKTLARVRKLTALEREAPRLPL